MKFSNFLFPDSASPEHDGRVIDETLQEARLTDELGYDTIWLAVHPPVRLAEQIALIDHISKGRLIVGLGRGTAYNIYDFQGYGIDHRQAQARFEEAEAIMFEAWKGEPLDFHGRFFRVRLPELRPA